MGKKVVTLGEIMLRLSTPGNTRFVQSDSFDVVYGGGEANVAVSCANYGHDAYFVTKLPKHEIGQSAVNALRKYGVKTDFIARGGDRVGIYYLETGASMRPSKVIYDRAHSAIAEADAADFDFDAIMEGADWFRTIGTEGSPGTKTFSLTGAIENTGLIEVPMGTTLRHIIYDIGGGLKSGAAFKGVQIGGPSGGCLILDQLDAPLDFDSVKKLDAIMGSGGLVVMDENTCMVEVARFFMNFTQRESCGKCVPCREGTKRMLEILERIVDGKGEMSDLDELEELAHMVQSMALCGLGKSAPLPVISTLNRFRDEYVEHIRDKKCHAKVCTALRQFHINSEFCIGCGKCAKNCPAGAITGAIKHPHQIDNNLCIKCGACKDNCNFDAVYVEM